MLKQKEWIEIISAKTGCSNKEAKIFYDCVFDYIKEQISPEELIKIQGFGVLKLRKTAAKEQINLITGKPEIVPEHNVITFKPYFIIDPKPEAIEIEDEDVALETAPVVEETAPVVEEAAPVVEEVCAPAEDDGLVWVVKGEQLKTCCVKKLLKENTSLSEEDIDSALNIVKENMVKHNKTTCEVKEADNSFDFVIVK